jgi:hypothetical protein
MNRQCDLCHEINTGENWCFKISDDRESKEFNGHSECVNQIYTQFKSITNYTNKSVKNCLKELKL